MVAGSDHVVGRGAPHVLVLSPFSAWPAPLFGAQLRSGRIAEGLTAEFRVSFATSTPSDDQSAMEAWRRAALVDSVLAAPQAPSSRSYRWGGLGDTLRGLVPGNPVPIDVRERISSSLLPLLVRLQRDDPPDVVWAYRTWMGETAKLAGFARVIIDIDDFGHAIWKQEIGKASPFRRERLHRRWCERLRRYERSVPSRFAHAIVSKLEDLHLIDTRLHDRVSCVPNGMNLPPASTMGEAWRPTLLFVGLLDYPPNVDAITWFVSEILPHVRARYPDAEFVVAGRSPVAPDVQALMGRRDVRVVVSPLELTDLYAQAHVVVTPIREGHGTRIKFLEALAHQKPLVSTREAARGHAMIAGEHYLAADTAEEFARACLSLLGDPTRRRELSNSVYSSVRESATWKYSTTVARSVVRKVLAQGTGE